MAISPDFSRASCPLNFDLDIVLDNDGMTTLPGYSVSTSHQHDCSNDCGGLSQQALAIPNASIEPCHSASKHGPVRTPRTRRHKVSQHLTCAVRGCTHEGTFSRKWELQRHIRSRHPRVDAESFVCGAEGCFNKQLPWTFTRADKLTSHIKANHRRDTIFASCPVTGCAFGRCDLETLGVHIARVHEKGGTPLTSKLACKQHEEGRAVFNASTCKVHKCPLWQCGRHVKAHELLHHVAGHAKDDVLATTCGLESECLVVFPTSGSSQSIHAQRELIINVQCPICNTKSGNIEDFVAHLWGSHLLTGSGGLDHYIAWRSELVDKVSNVYRDEINGMMPWKGLTTNLRFKREVDTMQCPSCLLSFSGLSSWKTASERESRRNTIGSVATHHILLRSEAEVVAELKPCRMQILRLYPEFVSHPVFGDFDEPQDGIAPSSQEPSHFVGTGFMESVENHGQAMADSNTLF